jgi:hypothetical protein
MATIFELTPEEFLSFEETPAKKTLHGPLTLMRCVGLNANGVKNSKYGRFWFDQEFFLDVLDQLTNSLTDARQVNQLLKLILRDGTAVCYDWNSFGMLYQLQVPVGAMLEVFAGTARSQPFYSRADPKKRSKPPNQVLGGGEDQYIVNMTPKVQGYVQGPIPIGISAIGHAGLRLSHNC